MFAALRRQLLVQHAAGLLAPHLLAHPVQAAVLRQPLPQRLAAARATGSTASAARGPGPRRSPSTFSASAIRSRIIEAFTSLHRPGRAAPRAAARSPACACPPLHALLRQRPQPALQPRIHLLLHKRLRNRELVPRDHLFEHLVLRAVLERLALALRRVLPQLALKLLPALVHCPSCFANSASRSG